MIAGVEVLLLYQDEFLKADFLEYLLRAVEPPRNEMPGNEAILAQIEESGRFTFLSGGF